MKDNDIEINLLLERALVEHGIRAEVRDGWVALDDTGPALRGFASVLSRTQATVVMQLDVHMTLPDGRLLVESFGGEGESVEAATTTAFKKFTLNSLHPLLCAFFGHAVDDHVNLQRWTIGGKTWDVYDGNFATETRPFSGEHKITMYTTPVKPPESLPEEIELLIRERDVGHHRIHWARVFFAYHRGKAVAQEALWNGRDWPEAQKVLAALNWKYFGGYYSVRCFFVLKRQEDGPMEERQDYRSC